MTSSSWDVIIVGAGSAGLPAAIFAAKRGARVLQIEADGRVGGTLFWSSGQISAAGTRLQKSLGIEDSWQEHYEDVQRIAKNTVDPTLGRLAVQHASDTFEWLIDIGFKPAPETPLTSMGHEPYRTRRYYWGNNLAVSILEVIRPVHERLVAAGKIDLRLATKMVELLHEGGRVTGIVAEKNGVRETFRGQNVVLTTGGYAANPELWKELTPGYPLRSRCNPYSRGDGIRAARAIGAKVDGGDKLLCSFAGVLDNPNDPLSAMAAVVLAPQRRMPWEIFVNHEVNTHCSNRKTPRCSSSSTKAFVRTPRRSIPCGGPRRSSCSGTTRATAKPTPWPASPNALAFRRAISKRRSPSTTKPSTASTILSSAA